MKRLMTFFFLMKKEGANNCTSFIVLEPEGLELSREELIVQKIHWLGCLLTFLGGLVWMSIQAVISIFLSLGTKKGQWRRRLAFFRCIIVMTSIIIIFSGIATGLSSAVLPGDQGI